MFVRLAKSTDVQHLHILDFKHMTNWAADGQHKYDRSQQPNTLNLFSMSFLKGSDDGMLHLGLPSFWSLFTEIFRKNTS
jgi:hypothetical protein